MDKIRTEVIPIFVYAIHQVKLVRVVEIVEGERLGNLQGVAVAFQHFVALDVLQYLGVVVKVVLDAGAVVGGGVLFDQGWSLDSLGGDPALKCGKVRYSPLLT